MAKAETFVQTKKKLSSDDISILKKLTSKYGDDIKAMFRDKKTNYMQWSKGEIKQKLKSY